MSRPTDQTKYKTLLLLYDAALLTGQILLSRTPLKISYQYFLYQNSLLFHESLIFIYPFIINILHTLKTYTILYLTAGK